VTHNNHKDSIQTAIVKVFIFLLLFNISQNCFAFNVPEKGTWLGRQWLEKYDPDKIARLANELKRYEIDLIYPALSYGSATKIIGTDKFGWINHPENATRFIKEIRNICPGIRIIPFKGVRVCGEKSKGKDGNFVIRSIWNDIERREKAIDALVNSMQALDADGIQFDLECNDIDDFANKAGLEIFFRELKKKMGNEKVLSVAIPILSQNQIHYHNNNYRMVPWKESLLNANAPGKSGRAPHVYEVIFRICDEVIVMYYDTGISDNNTQRFIDLMEAQTWASAWFSQRFGGKFFAGIRLSTTKGRQGQFNHLMHDYRVENTINTRIGILNALHMPLENGKYMRDFLNGIVIYRLDVIYENGWKKNIGSRYLNDINEF